MIHYLPASPSLSPFTPSERNVPRLTPYEPEDSPMVRFAVQRILQRTVRHGRPLTAETDSTGHTTIADDLDNQLRILHPDAFEATEASIISPDMILGSTAEIRGPLIDARFYAHARALGELGLKADMLCTGIEPYIRDASYVGEVRFVRETDRPGNPYDDIEFELYSNGIASVDASVLTRGAIEARTLAIWQDLQLDDIAELRPETLTVINKELLNGSQADALATFVEDGIS